MGRRNQYAAAAWERHAGPHRRKDLGLLSHDELEEWEEWEPMQFEEFATVVVERMKQGHEEYGDRSFQRPWEEIEKEILEEALDLVGWGYILWCRAKGGAPAENRLQWLPNYLRAAWYQTSHPPPQNLHNLTTRALWYGARGRELLFYGDRFA